MLAPLLARTAGIRRTYTHLRFISLVCFLAALSVLTFAYFGNPGLAPLAWPFFVGYLLRKAWLALRAHHAARQLGLERQFLGYVHAAPNLLAPLLRHSEIHRRSLLAARLSHLHTPGASSSRASAEPRRLLRRMPRPRPGFDGVLLGFALMLSLEGGNLLASGKISALFLAGASAVIPPAELYRFWLLRKLHAHLPSFRTALTTWLRETAALLRPRPRHTRYRHTSLYRARPLAVEATTPRAA